MLAVNEIHFGDIDRRHLTLRWFVPYSFREYRWIPRGVGEDVKVYGNDHLSILKIFSPRNWIRAVFRRSNWACSIMFFNASTHRCWCDEGCACDGRIVMAGFGLVWFYSHHTGVVPCPCDDHDEVSLEEEVADWYADD